MKILIAEDHELSRFKLETDLKKWGHEVAAAEDGEQAWELFNNDEFSIVITDWMMPNVDGLELVQRIRASDQADYVYIVMLTAKAEKHDIVAGMEAGADDFLTKPFHRDELKVRLRAGIRITQLNRQLNDTNRRMKHSLDAAARIQQSLLPASLPEAEGFEFQWDYRPCDELGGDMLNIVRLDDKHLGVYVLDVSGHGVPAALLATAVGRVMSPASDPTSLLVDRKDDSSIHILEPAEVAIRLNRQFAWTEETGQYFTLLYGVLNLESQVFTYTSAAHPPILYQRCDTPPVALDAIGFPIGMDLDLDDFEQHVVELQPKDRLLLYSDGLPDAINEDDEFFGDERLLAAVAQLNRSSLKEMVGSLMSDVDQWRGKADVNDDVSILAFEVA